MYQRFCFLCEQQGFEISEFWVKEEELKPSHILLLKTLSKEIDWNKKRFKRLVTKIRNFEVNKNTFSAREVKLLRKLVNLQKSKGYTNFEEVKYYFPCKTIETIYKTLLLRKLKDEA